jgi:hypothetical protein
MIHLNGQIDISHYHIASRLAPAAVIRLPIRFDGRLGSCASLSLARGVLSSVEVKITLFPLVAP